MRVPGISVVQSPDCRRSMTLSSPGSPVISSAGAVTRAQSATMSVAIFSLAHSAMRVTESGREFLTCYRKFQRSLDAAAARHFDRAFDIISSYPALRELPVIIQTRLRAVDPCEPVEPVESVI